MDEDNELIAKDFRAAISAAETFFYTEDWLSVLRFFFQGDSPAFVFKYFFWPGNRFTEVISYHFKVFIYQWLSQKYDFKQAL